jgi:arylsulfatase
MEVYAAFVTHTDHEIGRIVDFIEKIGQLDNTLIAVVIGDNGAEGGAREFGRFLSSAPDAPREQVLANELKNLDKLGGENSSALYPDGWAAATNTPFRFYKSYANFEGGTHDPLVLFYPKKIKDKGGIRNQYSYVNDIFPTTIELTGAKIPSVINGYPQEPVEGTSLAYTLDATNKNASERHNVQYLEMTGSYAIYKDGWKASFPNDRTKRIPESDKRIYLYNIREDFNELNDVAAKYPEKAKELAELFESEAWKYNVYPLKTEWTIKNQNVFGDAKRIVLRKENYFSRTAAPRFFANSFSVTAKAEIPAEGAQGVVLSFGNALGGLSLYVKDKKFVAAYNADGKLIELPSTKVVPAGKVELKADVNYSEDGKNKTIALFINGESVGTKDLGKISNVSSGYDNLEVGQDIGSTVSPVYKSPFVFTGQLDEVVIDLRDNGSSASIK